jgi:hypothetical protein
MGEDVFGNQLVTIDETPNLLVWDHEDGSLVDTQVPVETAIDVVFNSGVEWIDYYTLDTIEIGRRMIGSVPVDSHLHWTNPLILGGAVEPNNVSVIGRLPHLIGHGKLWQQLRGTPEGTAIRLK